MERRFVTHSLPDGEAGTALIMAVAAVSVAVAMSAAAVAAVLSNLADARRANAMTAVHAAAEAGADEFFAHVVRDPRYFTTPAGGGAPPYLGPGKDVAYAPAWATFDHGTPEPCADAYTQVCYQVQAAVTTQPGTIYAKAATVEVTAATLCPRGTAELVTCVSTKMHQRLTQRQFFDYLYFDQLETLDPLLYPTTASRDHAATACQVLASGRPPSCEVVPFLGAAATATGPTGGDVVYGPIHTNDSSFSACLAPRFAPAVVRTGWPTTKTSSNDSTSLEATGSPVFVPAPGAACRSARPTEASGTVVESSNSPYYSFAVDVANLRDIANPPDRYGATTTITLAPGAGPGRGTYRAAAGARPPGAADGGAVAWPGSGVIFIAGDAYVSGQACDPVSIAATGTVYVQGDLTYGSPGDCPNAATGLEADDAVVVLTTNRPGGPPMNASSDRTIEAAVLALGKRSCRSTSGGGSPAAPGVTCSLAAGAPLAGGSFFVQGWDTASLPNGTAPHYLHFLGAIATIWRGAIGAFSRASGQLVSGWAKDFAFDLQLRTTQPPYFLTPVGAGWARSDLSAVGPSSPSG